jgi:hypothetical protein
MRVSIQIGNEFLDLQPNTELELEQENLLLQFGDELQGEFSYPFDVRPTDNNLRLLNYAGIMEKRIDNIGIDAIVFSDGLPMMRGKIKIEKPTINLNNVADGMISCYFLSGVSSFYQDIKDKNLRDIDVGGTRSFEWDAYADTGPGFWGHIKDIMTGTPGYGPSGYDYAFFPVINYGWPGFDTPADIMNYITQDGGSFDVSPHARIADDDEANRIVPFPYLKYVMIQAAAHAGWNIVGDILDDEDFKKIVMINFGAIDWVFLKKVVGIWVFEHRDPVEFDLKWNLPDITISRFFIALKNRFGWKYDFDKTTKTIYINELNAIANGDAQDFTSRSNPVIPKQVNQDVKIYALRNSFSPDISDGAPDLDAVSFQGNVNELTDLPAAAEALYAHTYLVVAENNYYICKQNADTEAWEWNFYASNIFDYEPDGYTDEITTEATTIGNEKYNDYLDLLPRIDGQGTWFGTEEPGIDWGIILCFFHGLRNNKSDDPIPYGSAGVYDSKFVQVGNWSLAFECFLADGTDVGLYERGWRKILSLLGSVEEADVKLYLNLIEYLQLSFADKIVIRNVQYFIKTMKPRLPYRGEIDLRVVRI